MINIFLLGFLLLILWPIMFFISLLGLKIYPRHWMQYLPLLLLSIFIIVYSFNPKIQIDLIIYFNQMEYLKNLSLKEAYEYFGDGLFVKNIIFWIIGKMGCKHLLPALSTTTVYGITFYITCDTAKRYQREKLIIYIMLFQWVILPFTSIISNVRNVCSFSLIILAVYREIIKNKKDVFTVLLYIAPCFIHTSAVIILFIRMSLFLIGKARLVAIFFITAFPSIITFLYQKNFFNNFSGNIGRVLRLLIYQGYVYLNDVDSSEYARSIRHSVAQNVDRIIRILIMLWMILLMNVFEKSIKEEDKKFWKFLFYVCVMTMACGWITVPHYWRFAAAAVVAGGSLFLTALSSYKEHRKTWINKCLILPIPLFLLWATLFRLRNNHIMVSYNDWINAGLETNVFTILFDIISG